MTPLRKRRISQIWLYFVAAVFAVMIITITIIAGVALLMFKLRYLHFDVVRPVIPLGLLLMTSIAVGAVLALIVGKRVLTPITDMIAAEKQIAGGDFTVRLDSSHHIEEFRELAENFNAMAAELGSIETLRNDFIVNVSHEFKTPIASIEGYATLLQDETLSAGERREYTRNIIFGAKQLSALTGNILKLSKLENQEIIAEKHLFALDESLRQTIILFESKWSEKSLDMSVDLDRVDYYGSEELLSQVWSNLISNAIKFSRDGGLIDVTLSVEKTGGKSEAVVKVKDSGIGIELSQQKHIFEKFYQCDSSRFSGGNGLGLALVKRIVDLSGGSVSVESQPGSGSEFTVRLPMQQS